MATFKRAPMPRAGQFVNQDGSLTAPALNYLGNLEKLLDILVSLNGTIGTSGATEAAAVAAVVVAPVTTAYNRAGASYTALEIDAALDEIRLTTVPAINDRLGQIANGLNAVISALKAANLMET